jgi:hypothetical protein
MKCELWAEQGVEVEKRISSLRFASVEMTVFGLGEREPG